MIHLFGSRLCPAVALGALVLIAGISTARGQQQTSPDQDQDLDGISDPLWQTKLDPQMAEVLQELKSIAGTPIYKLSAQDARQQFSAEDAAKALARKKGLQEASDKVGGIKDTTIPGPGGPLPVRIYTPFGKGPFPVVVYFHGGGFVIATIDTYDASAGALTNMVRAIVISVEYRKAPEHRFPAAVDDAFASYKWALQNAASVNGDPSRVAVAGESAGGNLAAVICLLAREQGVKMPVHQVLVYPITDNEFDTPSYQEYAHANPLNKPSMKWFFHYYLPKSADGDNPLVSPLETNLQGLPPATIIGAEIDPLQSEGEAYADRLRRSGVAVDYKLYLGVTHEFFGMGAVVDKAKQAESQVAADLRRAFLK